MHRIRGDYLVTYDSDFLEAHNDSSDFEESCVPIIAKRKGNHRLVGHEMMQRAKEVPPYPTQNHHHDQYDEYPVKLKRDNSRETWGSIRKQASKTITFLKKKKHKPCNLNNGDQPELGQSKMSLFRHKVIPCLSCMFRRSYKSSEKNQKDTRDNSCQHCSNCEKRRTKKLYRRQQNYAVQPVYAIEGDIHKIQNPFSPMKIADVPYQNRCCKKSRNKYSSCSMSSSESETQLLSEEQKQKCKRFKKKFKTEILKEHWRFQQNQHVKNQQHQYPSQDHKSPYQVFTSPYQQSRTNVSPTTSQYVTDMPSSSSSFWEYLFEKMNRKYQTQRVEMPKPCQCSSDEHLPCCSNNCGNRAPNPEVRSCGGRNQNTPGNSCNCNASSNNKVPLLGGCCQNHLPLENLPPMPSSESIPISLTPKPADKKIQCKCYDRASKLSKEPLKDTRLPSQAPRFPPQAPKLPVQAPKLPLQTPAPENTKPCQEGHDEITAYLTEKYNGEILCIHNPPCILINGCLNLPPQKDSPQMNFWPVTETDKSVFCASPKKKKSSIERCEQACQYHIPSVEMNQCQTPECTEEKNIQSICHHYPPCEVVRGCYKPKYDPRLQNSCVHVPMCDQTPECMIGTSPEEKSSCQHRPRCPDIPICSKNYTVLTAGENFGAQVRPGSNQVCRHTPPCIMLPKCFGRRMCESYVSCDVIPDCVHQPLCEMIPACCRRSTKEMVSVSSQYPNSCRIV